MIPSGDQELARGMTVGEYVVEGKLGSGTFGHVYGAVQPLIGKQVAIKVLSRKYSADPDIVSRFIAEARAVNQIRHKNIIDIFSFGQLPDGRHYHIMELLSGTTLDQHLRERGRLSPGEALLVLRPLARALDAAHACGIAHRDLKPANVFLATDDDGRPFPKLLDFGIAKLLTDQMPVQHQTATGAAVGTPDYMSPEQCQGPNIDHRTDIYAFGIMTYQLLTGQLPFTGANVVEVLVKQMTATAVNPSELVPDVPQAVDAPIQWMLAKNKEDRPPDLATAIGALENALAAAGFDVPRTSSTGDPVVRASLPPESITAKSNPRASNPPLPRGSNPSMSLGEPGIAATLPSDRAYSAPVSIAEPKSRTPMLLAGGGMLAVVTGLAIAVVAGRMMPEAETAVISEQQAVVENKIAENKVAENKVAENKVAEGKTAEPAPPPALPQTITLRVVTEHQDLEVIGPGGMILGRGATQLVLPRGAEKVHLELKAPGHVTEERDITPIADGELVVKLTKANVNKKVVIKKVTTTKKKRANADDIESFD